VANPAAAAGGGKIAGLKPRTALIAVAVATVAGVAFFWWRSRNSSSAAAASGSAPTGCTDGSGNAVPCPESGSGTDDSGALSVIQTELESLLATESAEGSGGGSGFTPSPTPPITTPIQVPPSSGSGGGGSTTPPAAGAPAMPSGIKVTAVTPGGFKASWPKVPRATGYQYRITYQGKLVLARSFTAPSLTVSGLTPDHTYTLHVKACNAKGCSAETGGPTVKTPK
jgi:hypothetical protein